ncbi:hypothetical protein CK203_055764 [Vitis vinifera]|uniref:Uncharacterized protein n=1 Tax=Vitis vinifera TaxID=29760 RepID=A0A438H126_VITVI|nr:hypothetical protein CK203_055764 [Vitis vinifera]
MARAFKSGSSRDHCMELTPEGAAWLMDLDGNQFSEPTNVDQLKRHHWVHGSRDLLYLLHFIHEDHPEAMGSDIVFYSFYVDRITCLMRDDLMSPIFPDLSHVDAILGHIPFRRIFTDLRRARFILFDIVVIPGWGYVECLDSRIVISAVEAIVLCMSITASITRPRYIVFVSLTIIPELFIDMSSQGSVVRDPSAFRATSPIVGIQSHHHFLVAAFRAIIASQSTFRVTFSVSAFRVVITSQFDVQSPSSLLSFGVQSHHRFSDRLQSPLLDFGRSESLSLLSFDVQSHHHHFLVSAFRAIIGFQIDIQESPPRFRRSESLSLLSLTFRVIITTSLSFGIQSHHRFSDRHSESHPRFRRSESLSLLNFGVQSHHHDFSVSAFRAIIDFQINIPESHPRFRRSESVITSQLRCSEPSSLLLSVSAFRAVIDFQIDIRVVFSVSAFRVVITSQLRCSEPSSYFPISTFRAIIDFQIDIQSHILGFGVQSHYHFSV